MATISISRTISAAHLTRAVAALKDKFSLPDGATNQEIHDAWEAHVWSDLKGIVLDYERRVAAAAAEASQTDIDLT